MEFIFGTLATDELKLVQHRTMRTGVQHAHRTLPRDPKPGEPIVLDVWVGPELTADGVTVYFTIDGTQPTGSQGQAQHGQALALQPVEIVWDTLRWGYLTRWRGELPAQANGTMIRYRIGAWSAGGEVYADTPNVKHTSELAALAFFRNQPVNLELSGYVPGGDTFVLPIDEFTPPTWAREAVIYHIFVDRFYPGNDRDWLQTTNLRTFCGGDAVGVLEKLDYLADLGVTCLWLSPTWVSPTHHGYDVTDYFHTEPRLGGDEALRAVIEVAPRPGMRVLLDMVCNHLSNQHPIFTEAFTDPTSRYRNWFTFDQSEIGYRTFFGVKQMPQINVTNPEARQWLIEIAQYWLREFDVDGYRLDHANGCGPDFWADFRAGCRAVKPDCYLFGEVVDSPDVLLEYAGRLDGLLDFIGGDALRDTFGRSNGSAADYERFIARHQQYFGDALLMPTFLDNHDMDRFLFIAGGDTAKLRQAAQMQFRLPGPPIIYYGTETGLLQTRSVRDGGTLDEARPCMLWDEAQQDRSLFRFYQELTQQRRAKVGAGID